MMEMRILTVVSDLGPGGTQRAAQNYALAYASHQHASAVLCFEGGGPRVSTLREAGVDVFVGGDGDTRWAAVEEAVTWAPDLVHVHRRGDPYPPQAPVLLRLAERLSSAAFVETSVFSRADPGPTGRMFDVHLQLTPWGLWKWTKWSRDIHPQPIGVVVPYIVDPKGFYPDPDAADLFRRDHGIPEEAVLFGRIGQPIEAKWMPQLVDSFERVATDAPQAHLLLVGAPPSVMKRVDALSADIRQRVHVIDFLHGDAVLRAAYSAIDVFVLAAHIGESFGMVIAESMLCQTPVIALSRPYRDNSQVNVVGHQVGGLVVANPSALSVAMDQLLRDESLRQRLGRQAAARIHDRYVFSQAVPPLLRILEMTLAAPSREALRRQLEADPDLVTHISDQEVEDLLKQSIGDVSWKDRVLKRIVHKPKLIRLWRRLREP